MRRRARYWLDAACDLDYPEALQQKSVALAEGQMGYAHNEEQSIPVPEDGHACDGASVRRAVMMRLGNCLFFSRNINFLK